jgi:hypothetical protein
VPNVDAARERHDDVGPCSLHDAVQPSRITYIHLFQDRGIVHVGAHSRREVIDHRYGVTSGDERINRVRTDEPGSSCHQNIHCALPSSWPA